MKITFILPGIPTRPTGGSKIVFEYANRLLSLDSEMVINICFCSNPSVGRMGKLALPSFVKEDINSFRCWYFPRWFHLDNRINKIYISTINDDTVPDADWVFATASSTAFGVNSLSPEKGKKGYLIQDYETWELPPDKLDETFCLGMKNIAVSQWLKELVEKISSESCEYIPNPIDTTVFHPDYSYRRLPKTVALLYHEGAHKGFSYAWNALLLVKKKIPDLHVKMFGTFKLKHSFPEWVTYKRNASSKDLFKIYNESEAYLCASVNEGYALTCVEAMACGCSLVVTDFKGSREYAVDSVNAIVVPVGDVQAIADGVIRILEDSVLREHISNTGISFAKKSDWNFAIKHFANILKN